MTRPRCAAPKLIRGRDLSIGACDDDTDTTALWGRLLATDAAVLQKRVTAMAHGVCDADPRSIGERRADALGALANGNQHLACACGSPACPVAGQPPKSHVVIRVIAEQAAVDAATKKSRAAPTHRRRRRCCWATVCCPPRCWPRRSAPAPPSSRSECPPRNPNPAYRPSTELAEFVRMRDLFCRFPGCDVPAELCDIDHSRPWPWGPTHASNLTCKCRQHHLMKTFWTGIGGWTDVQLPDGTLIWTSPSGTKYTTKPGSRLFFPGWNTATAALPPPPHRPTTPTHTWRSRPDDAPPTTHPNRRQHRLQQEYRPRKNDAPHEQHRQESDHEERETKEAGKALGQTALKCLVEHGRHGLRAEVNARGQFLPDFEAQRRVRDTALEMLLLRVETFDLSTHTPDLLLCFEDLAQFPGSLP